MEKKDFFVSYTSADRYWAEWIAWTLEAAGYSTIIQAWDFRPGENFVVEMQRGTSEAERTILVLSEYYLKSAFSQSEWSAMFAQDPTGAQARLVPVRVGPCEPQGLLRALIHIDVCGLDEPTARERLLEGVQSDRAKPVSPPDFPGEASRPEFPGATPSGPSHPPPPFGRRLYRAAAAYGVTTGLVFLASWVGLLGAVDADAWLEGRFLGHMQRFLPPPKVDELVLVRGADGGPPLGKPGPAWRGAHAELVDALSMAHAKVIVFDLDFFERSEHDEAFAAAIRRASAAGTAVVLGANGFQADGARVRPRMSPVLADLAELRWGTLGGDAAQRRIELARRIPAFGAKSKPGWIAADTEPVVPSLALQAVMQHDAGPGRRVATVLHPRKDVVELRTSGAEPPLRTVPVVDSNLSFIVDVAEADDLSSHAYDQIRGQLGNPRALADFAGKVVVIGFETPGETWTTREGKTRYGMEIQASAIAQILHGAFLRRPGPGLQLLLILALGFLGGLIGMRDFPWTRRTLQLSLPVLRKPIDVPVVFLGALALYLLLAFAAFKGLRVVPRFGYDVLAFLLAYWSVGWATRTARRPAPTVTPARKAA